MIMFDTTRGEDFNCVPGDSCGNCKYINVQILMYYILYFL